MAWREKVLEGPEKSFRNADWKITPDQDSSLSPEQIIQALLLDIRSEARSIKNILLFFAVLAVLGGIIALLTTR
jgi:hypothetical protein